MAFHPIAADDDDSGGVGIARQYAWIVFALTFGLLISDYMSRQVLNAVFPLLKSEWALSDGQLGLLSGVVALMVGLLTFPLSLMADRFGRVKSLALMALLWSVATLGCALAQDYQQMFIARFMVGVGEAAYGSVGIAVVISVFPKHMRATLASAFMAGGLFGAVLGMALGGAIAAKLGWRWSFAGMALFGLVLAALYPLIVKEARIAPERAAQVANKTTAAVKRPLRTLWSSRSVVATYVGSGLQLFVGGTVMVWIPSYLNRYYDMPTDKAGGMAALIVLCSGVGMILCGMLSDRLCRHSPERKVSLAIAFCLGSCLLLSAAFALQAGPVQLLLICLGMLIATGTTGPSGAMVANLTHYSVHGTAFATLTLANNLLGLAPGPFITGRVSDLIGLHAAFQLVPLVSLAAAAVFFYAKCHYQKDIARLQGDSVTDPVSGAMSEALRESDRERRLA
ncbi:MFS transporter [Pseudomonas sp. CLCA07]